MRDYELFRTLFATVSELKGAEAIEVPLIFHERARRDGNRQLLAELGGHDPSADHVKREEMSAFGADEPHKISVARKLTLMSEMNRGFVADRQQLWLWVEEAFKPCTMEQAMKRSTLNP